MVRNQRGAATGAEDHCVLSGDVRLQTFTHSIDPLSEDLFELLDVLQEETCRNVCLFQRFLSLSRACLAKKIAFIYKWLTNAVFAYHLR
jgi:hypothetical protein